MLWGQMRPQAFFCNISAFIMVTEKFGVREITNLPWFCMSFTLSSSCDCKRKENVFSHFSHFYWCLQFWGREGNDKRLLEETGFPPLQDEEGLAEPVLCSWVPCSHDLRTGQGRPLLEIVTGPKKDLVGTVGSESRVPIYPVWKGSFGNGYIHRGRTPERGKCPNKKRSRCAPLSWKCVGRTAFPKSQSHIIHQTQQCFKKIKLLLL